MKNKIPIPLDVKILFPTERAYEQIQFTPDQPVWIEVPWKKEYWINWEKIETAMLSTGNPTIPDKQLSIGGLKYLKEQIDTLRNVKTSNFKEEKSDDKW